MYLWCLAWHQYQIFYWRNLAKQGWTAYLKIIFSIKANTSKQPHFFANPLNWQKKRIELKRKSNKWNFQSNKWKWGSVENIDVDFIYEFCLRHLFCSNKLDLKTSWSTEREKTSFAPICQLLDGGALWKEKWFFTWNSVTRRIWKKLYDEKFSFYPPF